MQIEASPAGLQLPQGLPTEYELKTADGKGEASLGINFVALTINNYSHWREFSSDLEAVVTAYENAYGPLAATRVGLRFINLLDAETTGLKKVERIVGLLRRDLTCLIKNEFWSPPQKAAFFLLLEEDAERLSIRVGLEGGDYPKVFLDFDCFMDFETPTEFAGRTLLEMVDRFHARVYDAFRWCLRDEKLHVFKPLQGPG